MDVSDEAENPWYLGIKAYVRVDSQTKLIHSVAVTSVNVHDTQPLPDLLHEKETQVWGNAAYSRRREIIQ